MDLNQVSVPVRDLAEAIGFYARLGFRLIVRDDDSRYARFELPSGATTFSIFEDRDAIPGPTVLYLEVDDVDQCHARLCALGLAFEHPPRDQPWRWREAPFADPTGNLFCLFHAGPDRRFPPWRLEEAGDTSRK